MPHTLIGIGGAGYVLLLSLWALFGADVPGVVTSADVYHSIKNRDSYTLKYTFQIGGQTKSGSEGVGYDLYQRYKSPSDTNPPVTVRYFSIAGSKHAALHTNRSLWGEIWKLALAMIFWNLVVGVFVYQLWVKPLRARWLYKYGETVTGTLLRKRMETRKSAYYYITYSFHHPYSGQTLEKEIEVWHEPLWNLAVEGQPVTVLFSRNNPKYSTVYEFGGYQVLAG